jgi:hypothetical protein
MKRRQGRSKDKVMIELFFNSSGIVHIQFIPEGATVNKHCYKKILHIYAITFIVSVLSFYAETGCFYTTIPLHIALCRSMRSWKNNRSPFWHTLHTHLILHHGIFLSFLERKAMWASISVG